MSNADVPPENESTENEIESPVDGPTPDWMRMATSAGSDPSLTEETTPDWLKDIKSGKGARSEEEADTQSDDDPYAGMSDLERLLAEEGIDLGTVEEDRPEDAAGMSTRDWMIATSDDEMIRGQVGAEPMDETPAPTPESPAPVEPEGGAPYAGMSELERLLAEEGIDLGAVEEERPEGSEGVSARDWMISTSDDEMIRNKIGAEPMAEPPAPTPVPETPVPVESEGGAPGAEMSDLERLLAEEGIDLGAVEEERPEGSEGISARDWMISTSDDEMIRNKIGAEPIDEPPAPTPEPASTPEPVPAPAPEPVAASEDDKMVVEDDLPDWLRETEDESPPPPEPVAADGDDKMVVEDDLPDWLREDEDETPPVVELPPESTPEPPTAPEPTPAPTPQPVAVDEDDKMVMENDLPDWLREDEDETFLTEELPPEPAPESLAATKPSLAPEPAVIAEEDDKMVVEDDLPDWLREDEDESPPAPTPVAVGEDDKMVVEDDLPDWLREDEDETSSPVEPLLEPVLEPVVADEDEVIPEDDLPDWLRGEEDEALPTDEPSPALAAPIVADDDQVADDEDLPDWLREEEEETLLGPEPVAADDEAVEEDDLPDWLKEAQEEELEAPRSESVVELATAVPAGYRDIDEEDLPDWLKDTQDEEGLTSTPMAPTTAITDLGDDLIDGDDLPDWLKDAQEEEAGVDLDIDDSIVDEDTLPDWLQEVETDEEIEEPLFADSGPIADAVTDEELPDWLNDVQTDDSEPFEPSEPSPQESEPLIEEGLPDWLQEYQDEISGYDSDDSDVLPLETDAGDSPIADEKLPDWLKDIEEGVEPLGEKEEILPVPVPEPDDVEEPASAPVVSSAEEKEETVEEEPTQITQAVPPPATSETAGGMPDWLKKLRENGDEEEVAPQAEVSPIPILSAPPPLLHNLRLKLLKRPNPKKMRLKISCLPMQRND